MNEKHNRTGARQTAEAAREGFGGESFLRHLFAGRLRPELIAPCAKPPVVRPEIRRFLERLERFLVDEVDPDAIDEVGAYPDHVVKGLARIGAFGMKIPTEYGGLGMHFAEYAQAMKLVGSHDANVTALLSAHQAIGVPQPVLQFGTDDQKQRYLPGCARGGISAFALTEPDVGSDPAKVGTTATPIEGGAAYRLDGEKLWCTNGTIAENVVVMARDTESGRISAFIVPTDAEGFEAPYRCHFMGLSALENGVLRFHGVRVPVEDRIGEPGEGLKIALSTLNTGRLSLPAATTGAVKRCLEICRKWAAAREQWDAPIGQHEAIASKLSEMAATAFAMEAVCDAAAAMADDPSLDIRMEAAAAKEWNTVRAWEAIDDAIQIRGGRGYETARSLERRGEVPTGLERMMRDARVNLIFEGSSEIMHLFLAREAVDMHLSVAGPFADPNASKGERIRHLPKAAAFYAKWYPAQWLRGLTVASRHADFGIFASQLRTLDRDARRLARRLFHGMLRYGPALEKRQRFLFRVIDVGLEIFACTCALLRAHHLRGAGDRNAEEATVLAHAYYAFGRRRIEEALDGLVHNTDEAEYRLGQRVAAGDHAWLEAGAVPLPFDREALRPEEVAPERLVS